MRAIGKISFVCFLFVLLSVPFNAWNVAANEFPSKSITIFIPYKPGGVSDITARIFSDVARKYLSQTIVIENRAGASGTRAVYDLVKSKPDGYTLAWVSNSESCGALHILPARYTIDDYTVIGRVGNLAVTITTAGQWNTLKEFVDYAKKNPGKIRAGVPGLGTVVRLTGELFAQDVGLELKIVPFQGSGPLVPATMGQHVEIGYLNVPEIVSQYKAGDLKVLCVMSEDRSNAIPKVPTARELGYDIVGGATHFVIAPNGLTKTVSDKLTQLVQQVVNDSDFQKRTLAIGYTAAFRDPVAAKAFLRDWYKKSGQLYDKLGMKKKK